MIGYHRQFAFVSSVLAGFAFAFYGTLLVVSEPNRIASWAVTLWHRAVSPWHWTASAKTHRG